MNKTKILFWAAVFGFSYDATVAYINRKRFNELKTKYYTVLDQRNRADELTRIYAAKLNQHRIPIDDFDRIIMHHLTQK
jgi:hypothetical protein